MSADPAGGAFGHRTRKSIRETLRTPWPFLGRNKPRLHGRRNRRGGEKPRCRYRSRLGCRCTLGLPSRSSAMDCRRRGGSLERISREEGNEREVRPHTNFPLVRVVLRSGEQDAGGCDDARWKRWRRHIDFENPRTSAREREDDGGSGKPIGRYGVGGRNSDVFSRTGLASSKVISNRMGAVHGPSRSRAHEVSSCEDRGRLVGA
jgi:hypothetical protein